MLVKVDRRGTPFELADAVPVRTGELVWIECGIPSGWGASMFWFDSEGHLTELGPSGRRPGRLLDRISYPVDGATTLVGPAGTDFIFVCARPSSPPQLGEVKSLFPGDQPLHGLPDRELIVLDHDSVTIKSPSQPDPAIRGAGPLQASVAREAVKTLESLRVALAEKFDFVAGVGFPHRDSFVAIRSVDESRQMILSPTDWKVSTMRNNLPLRPGSSEDWPLDDGGLLVGIPKPERTTCPGPWQRIILG